MDTEFFEKNSPLYFYVYNKIIYGDKNKKRLGDFLFMGKAKKRQKGPRNIIWGKLFFFFPTIKGEGIGSKLILSAFKHLKQEKKQNTLLWCLKKNHSARHFYEAMGGILLGEKELYLNQTPYSEVGYGFSLNKILL